MLKSISLVALMALFVSDAFALNPSKEYKVLPDKYGMTYKEEKIKTPDAIIAATALAYGYFLITNNEKDFAGINELKIINPWEK